MYRARSSQNDTSESKPAGQALAGVIFGRPSCVFLFSNYEIYVPSISTFKLVFCMIHLLIITRCSKNDTSKRKPRGQALFGIIFFSCNIVASFLEHCDYFGWLFCIYVAFYFLYRVPFCFVSCPFCPLSKFEHSTLCPFSFGIACPLFYEFLTLFPFFIFVCAPPRLSY